jgi:hypothetical protein
MINPKNFKDVFRFAKIYSKSKTAISVNEPWGVFATQALEGIKRDLKIIISNKYDSFKFDISNSQGRPSMPRVSWVAITGSRTKVSLAPSYTICFGRNGDGIVHGLMLPAALNFTCLKPLERTKFSNFIDIDGPNSELKYNNRFINPKEIPSTDFDESMIIDHLSDSLENLNCLEFTKDSND